MSKLKEDAQWPQFDGRKVCGSEWTSLSNNYTETIVFISSRYVTLEMYPKRDPRCNLNGHHPSLRIWPEIGKHLREKLARSCNLYSGDLPSCVAKRKKGGTC
jgi:hypothetical protein